MINTLQELLEDYALYSCIENRIDPNTSVELIKGAKDYINKLKELNLLNIPDVPQQPENYCQCDNPSLGKSLTNCETCHQWFNPKN